MNILVTGANGQLGHEMQRVALNSNHHYIFTDVAEGYEQLDITNLDAIRNMVKERNVNIIVNCAAYTNVDKAETDYDLANLLNNIAVGNLATAIKEVDGTLIHISTDYVFQGDRNTPCRENWATNPLGVYGKTKLAGEKAIEATGCNHIIIRTAWLYSQWGKNFCEDNADAHFHKRHTEGSVRPSRNAHICRRPCRCHITHHRDRAVRKDRCVSFL